jgi:chromosome segregation ATPase
LEDGRVAVQYLTDEREGLAVEVASLEARVTELTQQLAAKDAELAQAVAAGPQGSSRGGSTSGAAAGWEDRLRAAEAQLSEAQAARQGMEQELVELR